MFIMMISLPQGKFLILSNLVLTTTCYTFNYQFYQETDGVAMWGPPSSTTTGIYVQAHERIVICMALHPPKVLK